MFKPLVRLCTAFALTRSALATSPNSAQRDPAPAGRVTVMVQVALAANAMRALIIFLTSSLAATPFAMAQSRGELLYTTHCISCHTTEMHWRDKRSASNWPTLQAQVRRWQDAASLAWSDSDILEVSRYLNETNYHFEQTAGPVSSAGRGVAEPFPALTRLALFRRP